MRRKGVLVPRICREPAALCLVCLFSQFLAVRDALLTQMLEFDVLRMKLSNPPSLWCVYEQL